MQQNSFCHFHYEVAIQFIIGLALMHVCPMCEQYLMLMYY